MDVGSALQRCNVAGVDVGSLAVPRQRPLYYSIGRVGSPAEVADILVDALELDGSGPLLDIGCGPGSLTLCWPAFR